MLRAQFSTMLGPVPATIGLRQVMKGNDRVAVVEMVRFPPGAVTDATWAQLLAGLEAAFNVKLKTTKVDGIPVSTGTGIKFGYAVMRLADGFVELQTLTDQPLAVATSLITANPDIADPVSPS